MRLVQTKRSDLKEIRLKLLKKQDYKCKICGTKLDMSNPRNIHVDHQHFGEHRIRAVLCRRCNTIEGKLFNWYNRTTPKNQKSQDDYLKVLKGLVKYQKVKPTKYIYPKVKRRRK